MSLDEDVLFRELENTGLRVSSGIKRLGGNKALYFGLLKKFVSNHSTDMDSLESNMSAQNYDAVYRLVHSLHSVTGHIAADEVSEQLRTLVQSLKDGITLEALADQFNTLLHDYNSLFRKIENISFMDSDFQQVNDSEISRKAISSGMVRTALIELSEVLDLQQPGDSLRILGDLLFSVHDYDLLKSLKSIKDMIEDYNFSDSLILVHQLIEGLMED